MRSSLFEFLVPHAELGCRCGTGKASPIPANLNLAREALGEAAVA
jgi:hypothetical protein